MNKVMQISIAATAAIFLLAGCSAGSAEAQDVPAGPSATATASAEPEAPAWPYQVREDADKVFLGAMRETLHSVESLTDAELIAAGHSACEQIAAGATVDTVVVFDGDFAGEPKANWNDLALAGVATQTYCTEYDFMK